MQSKLFGLKTTEGLENKPSDRISCVISAFTLPSHPQFSETHSKATHIKVHLSIVNNLCRQAPSESSIIYSHIPHSLFLSNIFSLSPSLLCYPRALSPNRRAWDKLRTRHHQCSPSLLFFFLQKKSCSQGPCLSRTKDWQGSHFLKIILPCDHLDGLTKRSNGWQAAHSTQKRCEREWERSKSCSLRFL